MPQICAVAKNSKVLKFGNIFTGNIFSGNMIKPPQID